jgi:hypothetical protein
MNINQALGEFKKYKPFVKHSRLISQVNKKIGEKILSYAFKRLSNVKSLLRDNEKLIFENLLVVNGFKGIKTTSITSKEEFVEFVGTLFDKIDQEERNSKETSIELAAIFRIIADIIEIMGEYDNISEEWLVKSKLYFIIRKLL